MKLNFLYRSLPVYLLLGLLGCRSAGETKQTVSVKRRTISQEVVFSAQVLPYDAATGKAGLDGYVVSIGKIPGNEVEKGDTIALIRDADNRIQPLLSNTKGTLLAILSAPGQSVQSSQNFYLVGDAAQKVIQADLDEIDAAKLKVGQRFFIEANGKELSGTVSFVNALGTQTDDGIRFKVSGTVADPQKAIALMGVTMPVRVVMGRADSVLTVEKRAVVTKGDKHFIRLEQNGNTVEREVRVGLENEQFIEISGDIRENDLVSVGN